MNYVKANVVIHQQLRLVVTALTSRDTSRIDRGLGDALETAIIARVFPRHLERDSGKECAG